MAVNNNPREEYQSIKGAEKAAILMMTLSEEQASKIFACMDEDEIREISQAMANLGKISSNVMEKLYTEFSTLIAGSGNVVGSYENTERLLTKLLPKDKVTNIMEEIRGPAGRTMWDKLGNVSEEILATYLKNEYPQTISVVLSKIKPEHASKVLGLFPDNLAMEVVLRMLRMESVQKDILDDIERTLKVEFMSNLARASKKDAHQTMADIFNYFDRATETKFMGSLEERSQEAADKVKSLMFTFEDILKINDQGIQSIMRVVDKTKLALALKGASDSVKELFFKNMSERASKLMKEDMVSMGMVKVKDVDEAQSHVVMIAKEMSQRGEITIQKGDDTGEQLIG